MAVAALPERTWHQGPAVRVFDEDPALVDGLDEHTAHRLRRLVAVPTRWANPGPWAPATDAGAWHGCLGLLVVDGLLTRTVDLDGRHAPELLGPGALLRPWVTDETVATVDHEVHWQVESAATVALLDQTFTATIREHPLVFARLLDRTAAQGRAVAFQLAIAHVRSAERRMLMLLWHLADRWGTVTPEGVLLPLAVKQEVLAHLVCLRRPTASTALQQLVRARAISCLPSGGYLLHERPAAR